jgi:hypothetical protein
MHAPSPRPKETKRQTSEKWWEDKHFKRTFESPEGKLKLKNSYAGRNWGSHKYRVVIK